MRYLYLIFVGMIITFMTSCSTSQPASPGQTGSATEISSFPVWVSDSTPGSPEGMGVMGLFSVSVNTDPMQGDIVSMRTGALTDVLEVVDLTNFLQLAPCTNCVKIRSVSLDADGNVVVSIGIKHPFPAGDPLKPIGGRNRADLHVFNVEGIVVSNATASAFSGLGQSVAGLDLVNADGYTGYLDNWLDNIFPTDATIHPYKLHFDDYSQGNFDPLNPMGFASVTTPPPSGNLVMPMGSDYDFQDYVFNLGNSTGIQFTYAVGCTYAISAATKSQRFTPDYRIPQHNKKAASEVRVEVTSNNLVAGDVSSTAALTIYVLDMNNGVVTGDNRDQMKFESNVAGIVIEIPGIMSGVLSDYVATSGNGRDPLNPLTYTATVTNTAAAGNGIYRGLVKVLDSYPVGQNSMPSLEGKDGINRVDPLINPTEGLFDISEFSTYATFAISVSTVPQAPIAVIVTDPDPANVGTDHPYVKFDGSNSYDPDGGSITLFEWDFNWDGVPSNFVADISTADPVTDYSYSCMEGVYTAALRVTDDDMPSSVSDIVSVVVTVDKDFNSGAWEGSTRFELGEGTLGDHIIMTGQMLNTDSAGITHIITYDSNHIYHRTFDGTTLSARETLPFGYQITGATSALDADGDLHIVWFNYANPRQVEHVVYSGGNFGTITTLHTTPSSYQSNWINIQNNPAGDILVMWINSNSDWTDSRFMYTIDKGSGFTTPDFASGQINIRLTPTGSWHHVAPCIASTPDNVFHVAFYMLDVDLGWNRVLYELKYDGTTWIGPTVLYDDPSSGDAPYDIALIGESDGDMHLIGCDLYSSYMKYYRYDAGTGTWSSPLNISIAGSGNFAFPSVEVDDAGNVYAMWNQGTAFDDVMKMKAFCETATESEILALPEITVDTTTTNHNQKHSDVAWDVNHNLIAIYQDEWFSNYYSYFNRFVF